MVLKSNSIDKFFHKKYNINTYNCAHFVCEVWEYLTGEPIAHKLTGILRPQKEREVGLQLRRQFKRITAPETPCLALMQRRGSAPHVGIFLRGRIFHIKELGVEFQPVEVASFGFDKIGFYK